MRTTFSYFPRDVTARYNFELTMPRIAKCPYCWAEVQPGRLKCPECSEYLRCRYCDKRVSYSQQPPADTAGFGQHLVDRGLINHEQLLEALNIQAQRKEKFGRIALRLQHLDAQQVCSVLNLQGQQRELFGQTAQRLGLMDNATVEEVLEAQRESRPKIGALLIELGAINDDELARELERYLEYKLVLTA